MPKPTLISADALQQGYEQPKYVSNHIKALEREGYGALSEATIFEVTPNRSELRPKRFLSVSIDDENSRTQRLLYLPYSLELAEKLTKADDLKEAVWENLNREDKYVIIAEWRALEDDDLPVTYAWPTALVLQAYKKALPER